jgi:endogenous inhibitor of DNA gyrase (YacG/DUF329 family)
MAACPICKRTAEPRAGGNTAFPFCSARCKLVDLGKWLDDAYRVPTDDEALDIEPEGAREQSNLEDA